MNCHFCKTNQNVRGQVRIGESMVACCYDCLNGVAHRSEYIPERKEVIVKVLERIGYHDDHYPGEVIKIYEEHLQDMVDRGFVELVTG